MLNACFLEFFFKLSFGFGIIDFSCSSFFFFFLMFGVVVEAEKDEGSLEGDEAMV